MSFFILGKHDGDDLTWKIHQVWRTWRYFLIGSRIRLHPLNPAISGHHARRHTCHTTPASPVTGRRQSDHRPLRRQRHLTDVGLLALREMEEHLGIARRFAVCIDDPSAPARIQRSLADILRFHLLLIAAGYEDATRVVALKTASCGTCQAPIRTRLSYGSRSSASPASPVDQWGERPDQAAKPQPSSPAIRTQRPPLKAAGIMHGRISSKGTQVRQPRAQTSLINKGNSHWLDRIQSGNLTLD